MPPLRWCPNKLRSVINMYLWRSLTSLLFLQIFAWQPPEGRAAPELDHMPCYIMASAVSRRLFWRHGVCVDGIVEPK
jgi:hypothetical protein